MSIKTRSLGYLSTLHSCSCVIGKQHSSLYILLTLINFAGMLGSSICVTLYLDLKQASARE